MSTRLLEYHGSRADEDSIKFIDEAYQIVHGCYGGTTIGNKAKLVAYQLKCMAKYSMINGLRREERGEVGPIS